MLFGKKYIRVKSYELIIRFCPEFILELFKKISINLRNIFFSQLVSVDDICNFKKKDRHVFFGYYDINPFSEDDKKLLAMHAPLISKSPTINDFAEVGFYYLINSNKNFISIGRTNTWCWQQGCRLQWYEKDKIIFNCLVDGEYGAQIKEVPSGKTIKIFNRGLYCISQDGKWGLSLDFSRLQRLRPGYGYNILPDKDINDPISSKSKVELVNLKTNEILKLFSLKEVSEIDPHDSMIGADHYFNHLMFNHSGNKFLFFHLWMSKVGKGYSRLFVAERNGTNIKLVNNSGSVSHYNWISDDEIILYSYVQEKNRFMYAIFNTLNKKIKYFGKHIPRTDGHPTFLKLLNIIITDTYPDKYSQRNLLAYKIKEDIVKVLARFDSLPFFKGEFKCDLHPRISNNKKIICVDRIINERRSISLVSIDIETL